MKIPKIEWKISKQGNNIDDNAYIGEFKIATVYDDSSFGWTVKGMLAEMQNENPLNFNERYEAFDYVEIKFKKFWKELFSNYEANK